MLTARTNDGVDLCYETTGSGDPIIFVHEFAGHKESWEPQVRHFARRYQCVTYNARGYPPSSVPPDVSSYSQNRAVADILAVMDHLNIKKAHIVGLSMGGFATLHFGLQHPDRALSLVVAGCGYGAELEQGDRFRKEAEASAKMLLEQGMKAFVDKYSFGPTRLSFERADPRGFAEFIQQFYGHSALGSANTQLGVQRERPSLYSLKDQLQKLTVPTLIFNGDEDWPCLKPGLMLKEIIPSAALAILPNCGHTMNIEMPNEFNHVLEQFLQHASSGRWPQRDPRAMVASMTGMKD
ncbi:MAG: alpha/beta hydrolase [Alcaligenaceae bacterium]|nr:MAG: alpha/beta hydrolase [Alcaligenaceae bacterium]